MHLGAHAEVCTPNVAVYCDCSVAFSLARSDEFAGCQVFDSVGEEVWVGIAEDKRTEFHD